MLRFYKNHTQFQAFYLKLKLMMCPHCSLRGCLILHGYLYGNGEQANARIRRGHRIYCSNRYKKGGCGKTFSVLTAGVLPGFTIGAHRLWRFLANIKNGFNPARALAMSGCSMVQTSAYRLFNKFVTGQARIRSFLSRVKDPPPAQVQSPAIQTILHLHSVFGDAVCPITDFQYHFQTKFF